MDQPNTPTFDHQGTPTVRASQAQREAAARVARQQARDADEADLFLAQLGLVSR